MKRFNADRAILPVAQQTLWPALFPVPELGFVLYGGTALALRLGHRESVDFDFFTDRALDRRSLHYRIPLLRDGQVIQDQPDTLSVLVPVDRETVKLSFYGDLDLGRVGEPEMTDDEVLQVASLSDIFATKVKVILQRAEAKDYRDIAALLGAGARLEDALSAALAMYGKTFQPSESLKAMTYFGDGDLDSVSAADRETLIAASRSARDLPPPPPVVKTLAMPLDRTSSPQPDR